MQAFTNQGLIRPKITHSSNHPSDSSSGTFIVGPLERGFGSTLGVALRKLLMHALPGAAVSDVCVESPTALPADSELLLNLKELRIAMTDEQAEQVELELDCNQPGQVMALNISPNSTVRILNPTQEIAVLGPHERLRLKLRVRKGRGYCEAENILATEGWIALDRLYSPTLEVKYHVGQSRVGARTDYDQLTLHIRTDGSVTAKEALQTACLIFSDQLQTYIGPEEEQHWNPVHAVNAPSKAEEITSILNRRIDEFELSVRSTNCLKILNVEYVWQLAMKDHREVLLTRNMGAKSLQELTNLLAQLGLGFGMKFDDFTPELPSMKDRETLEDERQIHSAHHHLLSTIDGSPQSEY